MHIYALCDPGTTVVRYIGRTSHTLNTRFSNHISTGKLSPATARDYWIHSLVLSGREPDMYALESTGDWSGLLSAERFWIWAFLCKGYPLTNEQAGDNVELNSKHWEDPASFLVAIPDCPLRFQQPAVMDPSLQAVNAELGSRWRPLPHVLKSAVFVPPAGWRLPDWADALLVERIRKKHSDAQEAAMGVKVLSKPRTEGNTVSYTKKTFYVADRHEDTLDDLVKFLRRHELPGDRSMIVRALIDLAADELSGQDSENWVRRFADYCRQTYPGTSA